MLLLAFVKLATLHTSSESNSNLEVIVLLLTAGFLFVVAFLFNWIGLLAAICMTHTVAGRFGAISGFGLSMVKWVAIVKVRLSAPPALLSITCAAMLPGFT